MKKIMSFLLCAGMLFGFTACGGDDEGSGGSSVKISTRAGEETVVVTVKTGLESYQVWVVLESEYVEAVPEYAVNASGNSSNTFDGLAPDADYYAVVYSATTGYKYESFMTDPSTKVYESLLGSDYYVIAMDPVTTASLGSAVKAELTCDDATMFFDWWGDGGFFSPGTCSGPNAYGQVEGWTSLLINNSQGWFGGAFRLINPTPDQIKPDGSAEGPYQADADKARARRDALKNNVTAGDFVLHLAMKSKSGGKFECNCFDGEKFVIGTELDTYGFKRDGKWHEIEIPVSVLMGDGTTFDWEKVNAFAFWQAGDPFPADMNLDAVFFYKPAK